MPVIAAAQSDAERAVRLNKSMNRLILFLKSIHTTKANRAIAGVIVAVAAIALGKTLDLGHISDIIDAVSMVGLAVLGQDATAGDS